MNMNVWKCLLCVLIILFNWSVYANEEVAKVALIKGNATELRPGVSQSIPLQKDAWVLKNSIIETEKSSVVKLVFIDQSKVTLGPSSKLEIGKFAQNEAGILSVMKGKLKATVLKNALEGEGKNKLYIKTQTAAMGVRGTEFMVMYNHHINKTSVLTFSGEVVMAQVPKELGLRMPVNQLNQILQREGSISVRPGLYAGTSDLGRPNIPIRINPAQFQNLKDSSMFEESRSVASEVKNFQSKVPPNMDAKIFTNQNSELQESMKNVLGDKQFETIETTVKETMLAEQSAAIIPPAEGFYNPDTQDFAPKAGGFVDIETGVYIIPPPDSEFDPNTNTYIPPANQGTVDESGVFHPPVGIKKNEDGTFVKIGAPVGAKFILTDGGNQAEFKESFQAGSQFQTFEGGGTSAMDLMDLANGTIPPLNPIDPSNTTNQNSLSLLTVKITVQ